MKRRFLQILCWWNPAPPQPRRLFRTVSDDARPSPGLGLRRWRNWVVPVVLLLASGVSGLPQGTNMDPRAFAAFDIVVRRNIFDPLRRPPRPVGEPPPIVYSFSLAGTMNYDTNGPFAVFDGTSSDYHKLLSTGGRIANFTVEQITHDMVKLVSGTNHYELKVGSQMLRARDGSWSTGMEASASSYAYGSSSGGYGRNRNRYNSDFGGGRNNGGNRMRRTFQGGGQPDYNGGGMPDMSGGGAPPDLGAPPDAAPAGGGPIDSSDPVARMMARRAQETGSGDANPDQNAGPGPDQPGPGADQGGPGGPGGQGGPGGPGGPPDQGGQPQNQPGPDQGNPAGTVPAGQPGAIPQPGATPQQPGGTMPPGGATQPGGMPQQPGGTPQPNGPQQRN